AYDLKAYEVVAPGWVSQARYDVAAKAAGPVGETELKQMLQRLLAERFGLVQHREERRIPVYALVAKKKSARLHEAQNEGTPVMRGRGAEMVFERYTMDDLANLMRKLTRGERPIVDDTGIAGRYDFAIEILSSTPDNPSDAKRAAESAVTDPGFPAVMAAQ